MVLKDTLLIKHLPVEFTEKEKEDFVKYFGATSVKIVSSKIKRKCLVFAKFESESKAENALMRLHQLEILNSRLVAVYADNEFQVNIDNVENEAMFENESSKHFKNFINKLNSWNSAVNFQQPPPPHLCYKYPKANCATINNIAHALETVPKFYTQVLHLMNKMNLPPPFSNIPDTVVNKVFNESSFIESNPNDAEINKRLLPQEDRIVKRMKLITDDEINETLVNANEEVKSSSESELESDPENQVENPTIIPVMRLLQNKKIINRPKFIRPNVSTSNVSQRNLQKPDEIFEKVDISAAQKKIELRVTSESVSNISSQENVQFIEPIRKIESNKDDSDQTKDTENLNEESECVYISEKELIANRISSKDYDRLPVFKNYHPGAPNCKLYIKNLAKSVEEKDLVMVYKRYLTNRDVVLNVKLMKEGRMKGQAFVTMENVEQAQKALQETNGYILKGKPMVVVYAKSKP